MKKKILLIIVLVFLPVFSYAAIRTFAQVKNGVVENIFDWSEVSTPYISGIVFVDITALGVKPAINSTYDGVNFAAPVPVSAPVVRVISAWTFRQRLTSAERQALSTSTNAIVRAIADDILSMGDNVNLDDAGLNTDIDALVTTGLLTAQRKAAILQ